jgi:hypothetical protein
MAEKIAQLAFYVLRNPNRAFPFQFVTGLWPPPLDETFSIPIQSIISVAVGKEVGFSMVLKNPSFSLTRGALNTPTLAKERRRSRSMLSRVQFQ